MIEPLCSQRKGRGKTLRGKIKNTSDIGGGKPVKKKKNQSGDMAEPFILFGAMHTGEETATLIKRPRGKAKQGRVRDLFEKAAKRWQKKKAQITHQLIKKKERGVAWGRKIERDEKTEGNLQSACDQGQRTQRFEKKKNTTGGRKPGTKITKKLKNKLTKTPLKGKEKTKSPSTKPVKKRGRGKRPSYKRPGVSI